MSRQRRLRFLVRSYDYALFYRRRGTYEEENHTFLASTVIAVSLAGCKSGDYNEAIKLQEAGDYQAALELYENIEDYENYKDTAERVDVCKAMIEAINAFDSARSCAEQKKQ